MADGSAGRDTVAKEALHLADIRHRPAVRVRRNDLAVHAHFEYPTRAGAKSDLDNSDSKVESNSWASQAARKRNLQRVQ